MNIAFLILDILSLASMWFMWVFSFKAIKAIKRDKQLSNQIKNGKIDEKKLNREITFTEKLKNDSILFEEGHLKEKALDGTFGECVDAVLTNTNSYIFNNSSNEK